MYFLGLTMKLFTFSTSDCIFSPGRFVPAHWGCFGKGGEINTCSFRAQNTGKSVCEVL